MYYQCTGCGTVQLLPVPTDLGRYYPPEYYPIPESRAALVASSGPERYKLEIVRQFVGDGRLLEIGPAVGAFLVVMHEAGYETSAIEMDPESCEFLRAVVGIPVRETSDPIHGLAGDGPSTWWPCGT